MISRPDTVSDGSPVGQGPKATIASSRTLCGSFCQRKVRSQDCPLERAVMPRILIVVESGLSADRTLLIGDRFSIGSAELTAVLQTQHQFESDDMVKSRPY